MAPGPSLAPLTNGDTQNVLEGLTGYAEPGSLTALMGPSGSGKSTLLDALSRRLAANAFLLNGRKTKLSFGTALICHIILESMYQTEESMYNAAEEADGSVKFGQGDGSAYLFDPDIYTDGRISVQGIDGVLFPAEEWTQKATPVAKVVGKPRRGREKR